MKDYEPQRLLSGLKVPAAAATARERARHRALIAFRQPTSSRDERHGSIRAILNWRTAAGVAVMVGVVAFFSSPRPHLPSHAVITVQKVRLPPALGNPDGDRQVLQQLEQLFPREVDAVVEDNGKVDLSIAQSPEVGGSQPIVVVFQRQKTVIRVLSYSGHKFSLPLDGREHRFEILATATGGVILEENDQAWLATSHTDIAGYSVEALALEASL